MSVTQATVYSFVFSWFVLSLIPVASPVTPTLVAFPDLYEVRGDGTVFGNQIDEGGRMWSQQEKLENLQVLFNDIVFNTPWESCIDEKLTTDNKYGGESGKRGLQSKFQDVRQQAGFHHVHRTNMAVRPHCVFDIVVPFVNSSKTARLPGEFCLPEHLTGGAAVGDYNGDGMEDIFFTVFYGRSVLYKNNGDGTFTDVTEETGVGPSSKASGAVWADVDQDGDLDLYVTTLGDTRYYLYINYGGHFIEEAMNRSCSMQTSDMRKLSGMTPNVGDFNKDGFVDIYVTEWLPHRLGKPSASRLLRNKGSRARGFFEDVTLEAGVDMDGAYDGPILNDGTYTFGSSFTDFDNDGWPDLAVTGDYGSSKMFWNTQKGNFTECTHACGLEADQDAMGHAIGDWDNDGLLDWFSSAIWHNRTDCSVTGCVFGNEGNVLFRNLGGKQFEHAERQAGVVNGGWGWGAAFTDFDNDGFLDIVSTSGMDFPSTTTDDHFRVNTMWLWHNLGNGTTQEVSTSYGMNSSGQGRGLLKWDYDDDGDEDIVVANNFGPPFFYENQQRTPNNWIRIRALQRCLSNFDKLCDSIGARVQVVMTNNHVQTQEIGSNTHFLGQSSVAAHFGLGRDNSNVTVKVTWPSDSLVVTYTGVPPNTRLRAVKPESADGFTKTLPYSSLDKCVSLKVMTIDKQPYYSTAVINPDGRTVSLKINPGVDMDLLTTESFTYTIGLVPSPGGQPLTSNATAYFMFTSQRNHSSGVSECQNGRRIGPAPSVTDERRLDGTSNNQEHVYWGAAKEDVARALPAVYADDIAIPAGGCTPEQRKSGDCRYVDLLNGMGSNRPSPRKISNDLFHQTESKISARRLSDLHPHFGQFLAHDTDFSSPLPRFEFEDVISDLWLPIEVPKGDVHFDPDNKGNIYLPFLRSTYNRCTSRTTGIPRQQINKITSYIDGSSVYGESEARNRQLREFKDGKMKLGPDGIIPENIMAVANDNPVGRDPDSLLAAGDSRVNVQPGLIVLHSLFVREHNRICDGYRKSNPKATDEQLFQAARRLVAAELQAITFREYLPSLLGGMEHIPPYKGYKPDVDAGISNIMATAAFRYGHSQVNTHLWRFEENGAMSPYGHLPMRDAYFAPERVQQEGGIDPLLRGAVRQAAQETDLEMVDDMRNALFPDGLDLAAINIQRGRDHGLPDYNSVRKSLGLEGYSNFTDITNHSETASKLARLYHTTEHVDLWVGGLAEEHEKGSELGPTFRKIMMQDFLKIRDGDRFWYERYLSKEEIDKVNSLTLGKIIRLNTGYESAPDNVFFSTDYCAGVHNFQCVPHEETAAGSCENIQQKMTSLEEAFDSQKKMCGDNSSVTETKTQNQTVIAGLIVACVFMFLAAVIFLFLFLNIFCKVMRKRKDKAAGKDADYEMKTQWQKKEEIHSNSAFT